MLLFGTFQVLAVGPSLRFARGRIVVGFQNLVDERDHLGLNLSESTAIVVMGKQAEKTTSVARFSDPIQLLPVLPGASWDSRSLGGCLDLFVIIILIRVDHSVAEKGGGKIGLTSLFEHGSTFFGKIGWRNRQGRGNYCTVLLLLGRRETTRSLSMEKDWSMPGFAKPVGGHINVQIVSGDS